MAWLRGILAWGVLVTLAGAAEMRVERDIPYVEPKHARQTLDVYAPTTGTKHPVVFWIHGGGWRFGDKAGVQLKPHACVERGMVFVSTNYRFVPQVTLEAMTQDVARALRWTIDHVQEYGGDPQSIVVMGHSAGAHLAALVCTDGHYLQAEGVPLSKIRGCVPIDTAVYDAATQIASVSADTIRAKLYREAFGQTVDRQRQLSPITHVAAGRGIPPFLILHVASRADSGHQSRLLAQALEAAKIEATVIAAEGKDHGSINSDMGKHDDPLTPQVFAFVNKVVARGQAAQ